MSDSNFSNVGLLIQTDNLWNLPYDLRDLSFNNRVLSMTSVVHSTSTVGLYKFGNASLYFSNVSVISFPLTGDNSFDCGTGDFTIEMWLKTADILTMLYQNYIDVSSGIAISIDVTGKLVFRQGIFGTTVVGTITVNDNVYKHIAVSRVSGVVYLYVDGVYDVSVADTTSLTPSLGSSVFIGRDKDANTATALNGYIDGIRVTLNSYRYSGTSNFTPPTTTFELGIVPDPNWNNVSLLIHGDVDFAASSSVFKDTSTRSKGLTFTTISTTINSQYITRKGSIYFAGSNSKISVAPSADFKLGTGDFTIEFWIQPLGNSGKITTTNYGNVVYFGETLDTTKYSISCLPSSTSIGLCSHTTTDTILLSSGATGLTLNSWNHVVVKRVSGVAYIYIGGVLASSGAFTDSISSPEFTLGGSHVGSNYLYGYLQEIKVTKGVGYTPPSFIRPTIYSDESKDVTILKKSIPVLMFKPIRASTSPIFTFKKVRTDHTRACIPTYGGGTVFTENRLLAYTDIFGSITGIVKKDLIPQPNVMVYLYYRLTGRLIATRITDSLGQFAFFDIGLSKVRSDYFVTALSSSYEAVTSDNILPT